MSDDDKKKKGENWVLNAAIGALIILFVRLLWPDVIPFAPFSFWRWDHTFAELFNASWPILAWAGGVTTLFSFLRRDQQEDDVEPRGILLGGFIISVWAGVMEELCFRWLIFLASIASLTFINYLFFGWLGFGVPEFVMHWVAVVADFGTFHKMHDLLFHPAGWAVGAAMLVANARFRNGHRYLGWLGFVNSWYIGMFMFWMLFTFGLPAAMLIHFLYDMLIFFIRFLDRVIRDRRSA